MNKNKGFTLIEMMIVVAIIGILTAIAYPSYTEYVIRSNRSAAQQFMLDIANREEQYMLDARQYTGTLGRGGLNMTTPSEVSDFYTVAITANNAATPPIYEITATPITGKRQESDGALTLNSTGIKTPANKW
jgi:type IV pilus assembly protein PilE